MSSNVSHDEARPLGAGVGPPSTAHAASERAARAVPLSRGLSTKLLLLTIIFVLVAEVLIFLPSVANYRMRWLEERLGVAAAVSVLLFETDTSALPRAVQDDVLAALGAKSVAVRDAGVSRLLVVSETPVVVDEHVDIEATGPLEAIAASLQTLVFGGNQKLRVFGRVGESDKEFELVMGDGRLRDALLVYSRNVAFLSLLISLFTAGLVYSAIDRIMIRPIRAMTRSMLSFSRAPDDPNRVIQPEGRDDEIGVAQRELAGMEKELQKTLGEQRHLADLGLAVSKINHDMRNILASAQLLSDRLRRVDDPTVRALAPRLLRALDRAVSYSEGVMAYGRAQEPPPARRRLYLRPLVDEVESVLSLDVAGGIAFDNEVAPDLEIDADPEQLFRVLVNLSRNAVEAMAADTEAASPRRLAVSARREAGASDIFVTDTGPGLPRKARENLFAAFRGSARSGGTGLGLAIAQELARAHGGAVDLLESARGRTVFRLTLPDPPLRPAEARDAMRLPA